MFRSAKPVRHEARLTPRYWFIDETLVAQSELRELTALLPEDIVVNPLDSR